MNEESFGDMLEQHLSAKPDAWEKWKSVYGLHYIEAITKLMKDEDRISHDDKIQILTITLHQLGHSPQS